MQELDFSKTIDFEILGDIKPTVKEVLGYYATRQQYGSVLIHRTHIEFPAFKRGVLTYHGWAASETDKAIIKALYEKGLVKVQGVRE